MANSRAADAVRQCLGCRVQQCCCCSLRFGIIFISIVLLVNACLCFAGEAVLFFDLAAAITSQLEGKFLEPGKKLSEDGRVHGGIIFVGLYTFFNAFIGFFAAARRSYRAAYTFFVLIVLDTVLAIAIVVILWFSGAMSFQMLATQIPGAVIDVYCCMVCNGFRLECLQNGGGASGAQNLPPMSRTFDDGGAAGTLDDTTVSAADVAVESKGARGAAEKAPRRAGGPQIVDDDDEDGDLGNGGQRV